MSFVAPWMLFAGAAASLGVVLLHLLSTRRPPVVALPTARFVPESDVRAVARTSKPTDLLLLLLRVLAILLIALGFAQPIPNAPGPAVRSVVALEWTTALEDVESARREAQQRLATGDALVLFDTAARVIAADELAALPAPTVRRASLSPMYVAARDAARSIARGADSLRLVVLGAHTADAIDAATASLRAGWLGRVERVMLQARADTAPSTAVQLLPVDANDPLLPALLLLRANRGAHSVRIQRVTAGAASAAGAAGAGDAASAAGAGGAASAAGAGDASWLSTADSVWLANERDAVLILWPRLAGDSLRPDAVIALDGDAATLVAPTARREVPEGRVVARWRDGTPAVTERVVGGGCARSVGVLLSERGDLTLRTPFTHFLDVLVAPCGGRRDAALADSALRTALDTGALASAKSFVNDGESRSPLAAWLLAAGLLLLIAEQALRARTRERDRGRTHAGTSEGASEAARDTPHVRAPTEVA